MYPSICILILSGLFVSGCSVDSVVIRRTDIYSNACPRLWRHKAAADVGAELKVNPTEQKHWNIC